jgi:tRNA (guanine37-N1)-methyltransferase
MFVSNSRKAFSSSTKRDAMRIDVFTLFPEMLEPAWDVALLGKARERGLVDLRAHDWREYATDAHRTVDDTPYGGGAGMVLRPEPFVAALDAIQPPRPVLFLSPTGTRFDQSIARDLAMTDGFTLVCGRYEGLDQRVIDTYCDGELSIGDFVLGGGEVAALVVVEAVTRLVPGVMGNAASGEDESFSDGLLEYPQYTRPADFAGQPVPEVLRSGDHAAIARWRRAQALHRTLAVRPDLLDEAGLSPDDRALLAAFPPASPRWVAGQGGAEDSRGSSISSPLPTSQEAS